MSRTYLGAAAPAGSSPDPLVEAVMNRVPDADMEKFMSENMQAAIAQPKDEVDFMKASISMAEKGVVFALKYCKTPEERQAVVKQGLSSMAEVLNNPASPPELKKLAAEASERIKSLGGAAPAQAPGAPGAPGALSSSAVMPSAIGAALGAALGYFLSKKNTAGGVAGLVVGGAAGYWFGSKGKDEKKPAAAPAAPAALSARAPSAARVAQAGGAKRTVRAGRR